MKCQSSTQREAIVWLREGTHNEFVLDAVGLAPAGHYVGVVESNDDNMVNTLGLESLDIGGVGGDVGAGAGGSEGTGDGDENDLLVLELCEALSV